MNGPIKVICGPCDGVFDVAGKSVGSVRVSLADAFNIPYFIIPTVNGMRVDFQYVLNAEDTLEFVCVVGIKSERSASYEQMARALLACSQELQAVAEEVRQSSLNRDAAIDRAILLVSQHFLKVYGPLDYEARATTKVLAELLVAPLTSVAADVGRIANRLDPPPPDLVDTGYVAEKLGVSTKRISQLALAGELPAAAIVPGTGEGKPWRFYRSKVDPWIETR
jgi:hypothetical protein